jgi:SagB-type dehydrogenase family enzyme
MILNFGKIFHRFSKDKSMRGAVSITQNPLYWPDGWKKIQYKTYDRFPKIKLPKPELECSAEEMILNRRTVRNWAEKPVSLQQISNLVYFSCGVTKKSANPDNWKRVQGSAGERFPVEIYLINFIKGELEQRVYHYNVKEHALDVLWEFDMTSKENILKLFSYPWAQNAGFGIFLTGVTSRVVMKYGERGYRQIYLEAGAVAHMINSISGSQGIGSVIMSGTYDEQVEQILDIDGERETLLIGIALGNVKDNTQEQNVNL